MSTRDVLAVAGALVAYCAVLAALWAAANRLRAGLRRRRRLDLVAVQFGEYVVIPEPPSNVSVVVQDDVPDHQCGEPGCPCADLPND